ncbi:putative thiamine transport system ATP-binding protein [Idiomarina fontislapidosi]|uniref:ABC transporter ATP-binding protein n=1 Tax=Idiomarina fontislapidosi TaxID=263723 RepID=A0A432XYH7_9GAMM|nr:ATP-binding cassette domain-containing protein [Idiomarina fontislapidosi]PYE32790.1 putative thiamine transport system ATP-binding protein [Idiomarina fontislapidosi]RUO53769.1 ABC transporter ATP-binding protein [Idiomarina fontislapidosi]
MLEINHLTMVFKHHQLVIPKLSVAPGQVLTLTGASGIGKSSLLQWVLGVPQPNVAIAGELSLNGVDLTQRPIEQRNIGLVTQQADLFPHMTVQQNLLFARTAQSADRQAWVAEQLNSVGLSEYGDAYPAELSGGQRARIALLRSLAASPKSILLDEPFSALDVKLRTSVREFTWSKLADAQMPAMLVTHDPADAPGEVVNLEHYYYD